MPGLLRFLVDHLLRPTSGGVWLPLALPATVVIYFHRLAPKVVFFVFPGSEPDHPSLPSLQLLLRTPAHAHMALLAVVAIVVVALPPASSPKTTAPAAVPFAGLHWGMPADVRGDMPSEASCARRRCDMCGQRRACWGWAIAGDGSGRQDEGYDDREWHTVLCRACLAQRRDVDLRQLLKLAQRCQRCTRFASFAPARAARAMHCRRHSLPGEIDVAHRHLRCSVPKCMRQGVYMSHPGQPAAEHGGDDGAGFLPAGPRFCLLHKHPDDKDVISPLCRHAGCNRRALYGRSVVVLGPAVDGETQGLRQRVSGTRSSKVAAQFCAAHRLTGSRDLSHSICTWGRVGIGGRGADLPDKESRTRCLRRAVYGPPGGAATVCRLHRNASADVDRVNAQCKHKEGCPRRALSSVGLCSVHRRLQAATSAPADTARHERRGRGRRRAAHSM